MHIELTIDEVAVTAEVDLAAKTIRIGEKTHPFVVVAESPERVELDIAGERVVVEGWPSPNELPPGRLSVNGEVVRLGGVVRSETSRSPEVPAMTKGPAPAPPARSAGPSAEETGPGVALRPPMPGKVLEVRVANGDRVAAAQVVVVLEAMKMRNEVASPVDGVVAGLSVSPGTTVRARDVMLRVVPA